MALQLPGRQVPPRPAPSANEVLVGSRYTSFRFELQDRFGIRIGDLDGVHPGGGIDFDASDAIKAGGKITVSDTGQQIDWLNVRIAPFVSINTQPNRTDGVEYPCGVFLAVAPSETWSNGERVWEIDLLDKLSILDQDSPIDAPTASPETFSLPATANVMAEVRQLVESVGEDASGIAQNPSTLAGPMVWEVGETKLRIINDLLAAANFFPAYFDADGAIQVRPYARPVDRPVAYDVLDPLSRSIQSLMAPSWEVHSNQTAVPNRVVLIGQGDEEEEAPVGIARNEDPTSPYSFQSRGNRWITEVESGVEAVDAAALQALAERRLSAATMEPATITLEHAFLPEVRLGSIVQFSDSAAGFSTLAEVVKTTIPFEYQGLCSTELRAL